MSLLGGIRGFFRGSPAGGKNTRNRARVVCQYSVECQQLQSAFPAFVVDINRTGMRIESGTDLAKGSRFQVAYTSARPEEAEHPGLGVVQVEVRWSRKRAQDGRHVMGVRFLAPARLEGSWVHLVLQEVGLTSSSADLERRRHIRFTTSLKAELRDGSTHKHLGEGKVANLSVGGCMLKMDGPMEVGQSVFLLVSPPEKYPIFSVHAKVVRTQVLPASPLMAISLQFVQVGAPELRNLKKLLCALLKTSLEG